MPSCLRRLPRLGRHFRPAMGACPVHLQKIRSLPAIAPPRVAVANTGTPITHNACKIRNTTDNCRSIHMQNCRQFQSRSDTREMNFAKSTVNTHNTARNGWPKNTFSTVPHTQNQRQLQQHSHAKPQTIAVALTCKTIYNYGSTHMQIHRHCDNWK